MDCYAYGRQSNSSLLVRNSVLIYVSSKFDGGGDGVEDGISCCDCAASCARKHAHWLWSRVRQRRAMVCMSSPFQITTRHFFWKKQLPASGASSLNPSSDTPRPQKVGSAVGWT